MSQQALELLKTIGFLDNHDHIADLSRYSESDLQKMVAYYADNRRLAVDKEFAQLKFSGGLSSLVSSISGRTAVFPLLPSMLVYDRMMVNDPLFKLHREDSDFGKAHNQMLGFSTEGKLQHWKVRNALVVFEDLASLMRNGMMICLPLADLHKPLAMPTINFSEDWYRSDVPDVVHDFVHKNAIIREVQPGPNGKGLKVLAHAPSKPVRGIVVSFRDDEPILGDSIYLLHTMQVTEKLSESRFAFEQELPWDKPPEKGQYQAWVYQSINQTIAARLQAISAEIAVAEKAGAVYTTESDFEARLCGKLGFKDVDHGTSADAVNFLRANEPRLTIDSAETVLRLRLENPQMFEHFQATLIEVSGQLHGAADFDERAKRLLSTEIIPQVAEIETAAAKLRGGIVGGAVVASATIGLAMLTGPVLPLATVLGFGAVLTGGAAFPSVSEYLAVRKRPAFLWKQIMKN